MWEGSIKSCLHPLVPSLLTISHVRPREPISSTHSVLGVVTRGPWVEQTCPCHLQHSASSKSNSALSARPTDVHAPRLYHVVAQNAVRSLVRAARIASSVDAVSGSKSNRFAQFGLPTGGRTKRQLGDPLPSSRTWLHRRIEKPSTGCPPELHTWPLRRTLPP